ncbi:N-acetylglucosamine kinase [Streptomyces sp. NPDC059447]|uniref:N-acetylglucosamine kinase n=1 Tax=Streptomyces sp. NPDC059447 TaxID=3346834 RepID=UPI003674537A
MALVLGIDGGGSRLRAALAESTGGPPSATASTGAANARSVPAPVLEDRLAHAVRRVLPRERADEVRCVVAGFAGAGIPGREADAGQAVATKALHGALARHGVTGVRVEVVADTELAFAGAPGTPADGLAVIAGTGAAAARIRDHRLSATADGCGWLTGDDGSGFWIAREGVRRALRAADGRGPATLLVGRLAEVFGAPTLDPSVVRFALVDGALTPGDPVRLARHCPVVVRAAVDGDAVANGILDEAADLLEESTAALRPQRGEALVTSGGLLGPNGPLLGRFAARTAARGLTPYPVADGLAGAVAWARRLCGGAEG